MCQEATGTDVPVEYVGYRPGEEGQREAFSNEKARCALGYRPNTPSEKAISLTADWVRSLMNDMPSEVK